MLLTMESHALTEPCKQDQILTIVNANAKGNTSAPVLSTCRCRFLHISSFGLPISFSHVDPFAIIEASLTSVKYAFYHTFGYLVLHVLGYHSPHTTTFLTAAGAGFIGGAIFTVPYLVLLSRAVIPSEPEPKDNDVQSYLRCLPLLGAEMLYSAVAGGLGIVVLDGWKCCDVLVGMIRGFGGPFVSYVFLYISLKLILGGVRVVMRSGTLVRSTS